MSSNERPTELLVLYYSRFGVLKELADEIGVGALAERNVELNYLEVDERPLEQLRPGEDGQAMALRRATVLNRLTAADALIVGAPAYFGSMASPLKRLFEDCVTAGNPPVRDRSRPWQLHLFRDKVGAAFTASATPHGGNEMALQSMLTLMMHLGMVVVTPGQCEPILEHEAAPYGATAISGPDGTRRSSLSERRAAQELGRRVARISMWLHAGRTDWEQQHHTQPAALLAART